MTKDTSENVIPFPDSQEEKDAQARGEVEARARFSVVVPCAALVFMVIATIVHGVAGTQKGVAIMLSIVGVVLLSGLIGGITALIDTKKYGRERIHRWAIAGIGLGTLCLLILTALFFRVF